MLGLTFYEFAGSRGIAERVAQGSAISPFPLCLWKGKVLALSGGVFLAPGKRLRMMCDHSPRVAVALRHSSSYPYSQLHVVSPYLQHFVSSVAADDNLVFEGVLGLRRLNFPIDWWLHHWTWISFE